MKQSSLTRALFVAGVLAFAGATAQADAIFYPDGTVVELGDSSAQTLALDTDYSGDTGDTGVALDSDMSSDTSLALDSDYSSDTSLAMDSDQSSDTTVLGGPAAASVSTTTTITTPQLVYVQPNIHWDRATVVTQMRSHSTLMRDRLASKETFNVPQRAGEASTMTGGVPNLVTDNHIVVGGNVIPSTWVTVTDPYYVMSF